MHAHTLTNKLTQIHMHIKKHPHLNMHGNVAKDPHAQYYLSPPSHLIQCGRDGAPFTAAILETLSLLQLPVNYQPLLVSHPTSVKCRYQVLSLH